LLLKIEQESSLRVESTIRLGSASVAPLRLRSLTHSEPNVSRVSIVFWTVERNNRFTSLFDEVVRMRQEDLRKLVDGTSDAAYVINSEGLVVAWNASAHRLFGLTAGEVIGQSCSTLVQGVDECGAVCSKNCTVQQALDKRRPMENFDLLVRTIDGQKWCNVSVLIVETSSLQSHAIHIVRPVDLRKRLEIVIRDVIVRNTSVSADLALAMIASRAAAREIELSTREIDVLRFLAKGSTTKDIADELHISRSTVNNHVQHILHKLDSHTRLQAIRRAEKARLI